MGLFLDLIRVSERNTDDLLEGLYKSLADGHDHDGGMWGPHDSPIIQRLIELFTTRGLDKLSSVKREIEAWALGQRHAPGGATAPVKPAGMMGRWTHDELGLVRIYLEALPPALWTLDDHMMAVDYVVQRYLPAEYMKAEAEWLAVRAGLMGKVQANLKKEPTLAQADAIVAAMPLTVVDAVHRFVLAHQQRKTLEFAAARAAENVRALTDDVRHRMRNTILQHLEGAPAVSGQALQSKLFDQFATLNRDWRRIAITEAGDAQTAGFIASLQPGAKVERMERYEGACGFCRKINGRVMTVVAADAPNKDPETQVWIGKTNIGRSASPKKRVGDVLVDRDPEEMWTVPAGLVHPNCRGRWLLVEEPEADIDPGFADQLKKILSG